MKTNFETLVDIVLEAEKAGRPRHEIILTVGATPQILVNSGFAALSLIVKAKTIGKMFFDHGLTQGQIERIPAMLSTPKSVYKSSMQPGSVVVFTYELKGASPIIIPVARDRTAGRGPLVNEVVSMYAKTGPDPTPAWKRAGLLLWEAKP